MKTKKYFIALVSIVAFSSIALVASATHSWGGYHWARTTSSFTLQLGDNVSSVWKPYLATTSSDWSASTVLDTTVVQGSARRNCQPTAGRVEVCNKAYGNNGWLGLAQIWISGSHITQGTVKVNDTYFNTSAYNNPNEKLHVVCQEVGHTFGLDHQSTDGTSLDTCMDYFSNTGVNAGSTLSIHPNQHDYDELGIIYSHLDTFTTIKTSTTSKNASEINTDDKSEWGREVKKDANGHHSVFEKDLGNGNKIVTDVIWAQ